MFIFLLQDFSSLGSFFSAGILIIILAFCHVSFMPRQFGFVL